MGTLNIFKLVHFNQTTINSCKTFIVSVPVIIETRGCLNKQSLKNARLVLVIRQSIANAGRIYQHAKYFLG